MFEYMYTIYIVYFPFHSLYINLFYANWFVSARRESTFFIAAGMVLEQYTLDF